MMRGFPYLIFLAALALVPADHALAKAFNRPHMHQPGHGCQIQVGPVTVPRGEELTECTYLKMPSKRDMAVHRVKIKVSGGSHHVHLYRPADPTLNLADGHETCNMALDFSVWQLVLAAQDILLDWRLPPGVAYHYRGVRFTAGTWDGTGGEQLYEQNGYLDPPFVRYSGDHAPTVKGLQWTCTYDNQTDQTYKFGPFTDRNEHCNLFAFYYPTDTPDEFTTCVQKDGVVTTTVRGQ